MKRIIIAAVFIVGTLVTATAQAAITWQGEFDQFRYDISKNGGDFYYLPGTYFNSKESTSFYYYAPLSGHTDPYDSVALGSLTEFVAQPGEISMNAMAKATGTLTSPADGLVVQAFAETIPTGLDQGQAVDIEQKVQSWVTRLFTVDTAAEHSLELTLEGTTNFDSFNISSMYKAVYSVTAEVSLEQGVDDGSGTKNFQTVSGFPILMEFADPNQTLTVPLFPVDVQERPITYRLKVNLTLTSDIVNVNYMTFGTTGDLSGNYRLGSAAAPITLTATFPSGPPEPDELATDFNGDGKADILWRNSTTGALQVWLMDGVNAATEGAQLARTQVWGIEGVTDFDNDGNADILFRNSTTGAVQVWLMDGVSAVTKGATIARDLMWEIQ